jgi:hypothetical protein
MMHYDILAATIVQRRRGKGKLSAIFASRAVSKSGRLSNVRSRLGRRSGIASWSRSTRCSTASSRSKRASALSGYQYIFIRGNAYWRRGG